MKQHYNIQNNIVTLQYNITKHQKNVVIDKQYCKSTKQHNKTQQLVITYKV